MIMDKIIETIIESIILVAILFGSLFWFVKCVEIIEDARYDYILKSCEQDGRTPDIPVVGEEYEITETYVTADGIVMILENSKGHKFDYTASETSDVYSDVLVNDVTKVKCIAPYELEAIVVN